MLIEWDMTMRVHKMTEYDVGQVLIKASDTLFECAAELRDYPSLYNTLYHMGCSIGTTFNNRSSYGFGLRGLDQCVCTECVHEG